MQMGTYALNMKYRKYWKSVFFCVQKNIDTLITTQEVKIKKTQKWIQAKFQIMKNICTITDINTHSRQTLLLINIENR